MQLIGRFLVGLALLVGWVADAVAKEPGAVRRMATPPSAAALLESFAGTDADEARLRKIAEGAPPHSPVRELLEAGDAAAAREMLAFRPRLEAPLPEGFPAFTPVGLIEVKRYPAYRKADGPKFWPLFQHIQKQGIPMTAPVEMNAPASSGERGPMAFLYQNTRVGKLGPVDGVEVVDAGPAVFVSLGVRGGNRRKLLADARRRIEAWINQSPAYQIASTDPEPFRVLGYSSPMVPDAERYWEVQLRVVATPRSGAASTD